MRTKQKHKIKKLTNLDYNNYVTKISGTGVIIEPTNKDKK